MVHIILCTCVLLYVILVHKMYVLMYMYMDVTPLLYYYIYTLAVISSSLVG